MKKLFRSSMMVLLSFLLMITNHLTMYSFDNETESANLLYGEESLDKLNSIQRYKTLNDPALLQYVEDEVYAGLVNEFRSEDFIIENVNTLYYSKEYLEELDYNSKENIWFGYTLSELMDQFQGEKYIFTLGDNNQTVVTAFQDYDDTFDKVIRNVAIGTGVILVCVTVSVVTLGVGATPVSIVFAASAKSGTIMALSSGGISSVAVGMITGIQTGDMHKAIESGALAGSENFKWGAIGGAIFGGIDKAIKLRKAVLPVDDIIPNNLSPNNPVDDILDTLIDDVMDVPYIDDPNIPAWRNAELRALSKYGGSEQVTYLNGVEVPFGTPGASRPDVVTMVGDHMEAIEVKYYNFENPSCLSTMYSELEREISSRVANLPPDMTQRVVLDVTGRNFSEELVNTVLETVQSRLFDIYPNIPIDIVGL